MLRCTVSGNPIPFDDEGNELCLLYLKYGRCRYQKKCKRSHRAWFPPLPDEEPPSTPPLPSTSPPTFPMEQPPPPVDELLPDKCNLLEDATCMTLTSDTYCKASPEIFIPENETYLKGQNKVMPFEDLLTTPVDSTTTQGRHVGDMLYVEQEGPLTSGKTLVGPAVVQNSNSTLRRKAAAQDCGPVHNNVDVCTIKVNDENEPVNDHTICAVINSASKEECLHMDTVAQKLEKICRRLFVGNTRFQHIFKLQTTKSTAVYRSGIDKMFKDAGAYFNNQSQKLEVKKTPVNKIEKHYVKLVKRLYWKITQSLLHKLADIPPVYLLKVDLSKVNFTRLRPYVYLLLHECFSAGEVNSNHSLPSLFTILVSDTLLAQFEHKNLSPLEAEKKLCSWGARPVTVRKCVTELWNVIHRSSVTPIGTAAEVMHCEQGVRQQNLRFLDYAYACSLAASKTRAEVIESENKSIKVSTSVKQGLKSTREIRGSNSGARKSAGWISLQLRLKQNKTPLNPTKLPVQNRDLSCKHGDVTCDLSEDDSSNLSTEFAAKSSSNLDASKRIRGSLSAGENDNYNKGKRSRLQLDLDKLKAGEAKIPSRQRKRKRSRQFKGTSKEDRYKVEAKFRRMLVSQSVTTLPALSR